MSAQDTTSSAPPPTFDQRVSNMLTDHEGNTPFPYCDTCDPPIVTVGKGHALFTVQAAQALPFKDIKTGNPVSPAAIAAEYFRVKALKITSFQRSLAQIMLLDADVEKLEADDVTKVVAILRKELVDFDQLPDDARLALIDIGFNCGSLKNFPHLRMAVTARKWLLASYNAYRPAVSKARNDFVQGLLKGLAK